MSYCPQGSAEQWAWPGDVEVQRKGILAGARTALPGEAGFTATSTLVPGALVTSGQGPNGVRRQGGPHSSPADLLLQEHEVRCLISEAQLQGAAR